MNCIDLLSKYGETLLQQIGYITDEKTPYNIQNILLMNIAGSRELAPMVKYYLDDNNNLTPEKINELSSCIRNRYIDSWNKVKHDLSLNYDILKPYTKTTTHEETGTNNNTADTSNTVYGYDSNTGVDDTGVNVTGSGKATRSYTNTVQRSINKDVSKIITDDVKLAQKTFIDYYLHTIAEFIALDVW